MKKVLKAISVVISAVMLISSISFSVSAQENNNGQVRVIVENNTLSVNDGADWEGILVDEWVDIDNDTSILTALVDALSAEGYTQTGAETGYITEIGGLAENDDGGYMSGWMATLNDWFTDELLYAYTVESGKLRAGDEICFSYTCNWGEDLNYYWDKNNTDLSSLKFNTGELEPEFDSYTTEYTLTLPKGTDFVTVMPTASNKVFRVKIYKNEYTPANEGTDYRRNEKISVSDNDIIYIGVGNSTWQLYPPKGSSETVYKINISSSKTDSEITDNDKEKARRVLELINSIGVVTLDSGDVISAAREAYNNLTKEQKSLITNYDILDKAEKDYIAAQRAKSDIYGMFEETSKQMIADIDFSVGSEWRIMALSRADGISDASKITYFNSVVDYINSTENKDLYKIKATDISKIVIALSSLGYDVTNINGYDLIKPLSDFDNVSKQGINSIIYALIALDTRNYNVDTAAREKMIDAILGAQLTDGGWAFYGEKSDSDMTGMALQALAPYYNKNEKVKSSVNKAVLFLSESQNPDGTFMSYGEKSCESSAQVIVALNALSIDLKNDMRFVKNGNTAIDGLKNFYVGGAFAHSIDGKENSMSTEQAYYALVSYIRCLYGKTSLYDMTDIETVDVPENSMEEISNENSENYPDNTSNAESQYLSSVNTGDSSNTILIFYTVLAISFAAIIVFMRKKKVSNK